jgi:hypothetical protein
MSYVAWGWHKIAGEPKKVCSLEVWRAASWLYAVGFIATAIIYASIGNNYTSYGNILNMPLGHFAFTILLIISITTTIFLYAVVWATMSPSTGPSNVAHTQPFHIYQLHVANGNATSSGKRPLTHLDSSEDICGSSQLDPRLKHLICDGGVLDADDVEENDVLIMATYYFMFHRRSLNFARKMLNTLRSRNLNEKERTALEVLEVAYDAVADPPCTPQRLLRYMEKLQSVETTGWALLLKILVSMHISGADQDYAEGVKQGMLKSIKSGNCDNTTVCQFVYGIIDKVVPLCPRKQVNAPVRIS